MFHCVGSQLCCILRVSRFACHCQLEADVGLLSTAILATQVVIGVLTLYKKVFGGRAAWGRTPLSQLVMRDGTTSFAVILGMEHTCINRI